MTRTARIRSTLPPRHALPPMPQVNIRSQLATISAFGRDCLREGRSMLAKGLQTRLDSLFGWLGSMSERPLHPQFEAHPRVPDHVEKLNELLDRYAGIEPVPINENRRTRIEEKILSSLDALAAINDNAVPSTPQPASIGQRIRAKLGRKVSEDLLQDGLQALEILSQGKLHGPYKRYLDRLLSSAAQDNEIIGAMAELRAILYIAQNTYIEVLDANSTIIQKGSATGFEFFDIIGRDRKTGRLVIFEIKFDNDYCFGDFIFQFLGLGSQHKGKLFKPHSQKDVLLDPENFTIPSSYEADVKAGNYEIRILTHKRLYDFDGLYGKNMSLRQLLSRLLSGTTPISFSKKVYENLGRDKIEQQILGLKERMEAVGDTPIRFELIGWYQSQRGN